MLPMIRRVIISAIIVVATAAAAWFLIPDPGLYPPVSESLAIFDTDGRLIRFTLSPDESYRLFVPLSEITPDLVNAVTLYEDRYFRYHPGFNPVSLIRASAGFAANRKRPAGASTITMQTARMRFHLKTRTAWGKVIQIMRAVQLERHYSKDRILEAYFNLAPYGRNIEGVGAASLIYFGKKAVDLTIPEALTLAVIPQNPSGRCPSNEKGYGKMDAARRNLFQKLVAVNPELEKHSGFMELPLVCGSPETLPFKAPHFTEWARSKGDSPVSGKMRTTLDLELQARIEAIIRTHIRRKHAAGIRNAVALLIDAKTMSVLAMAGSADFFDKAISGQVNGATAKRSPGSALKPFVYALALDQGLIHPMTLLKDAPLRYGAYAPENFDKRFQGPLSATEALIQSRNVPALSLAARLQNPDIYDFLKLAGISGLKEKDFYGLSPVLGGCEVSMLEMAELYAMLANGGVMKPVRFDASCSIPVSGQRLISREAAYLILDMLSKNPSPAEEYEVTDERESHIAWKTGTSWGFRDAWAAGVAGGYVLVVWVGNFAGEGNPAFIGRTAAGPIFFDIMAYLEKAHGPFRNPGLWLPGMNLKKVEVCAASGGLPGKYTPKTMETWFIPGKSPITLSTIHRGVPIDVETGLRACRRHPPETRIEVFEFWPSDIRRIFQEAGIFRPEPPPFMKECGLSDRDGDGQPPRIISPDSTVTYVARGGKERGDAVPLEASAENGVEVVYWFAGGTYIGKSRPSEIILWGAGPGEYQIRAVDDQGRAAVRRLSVRRE